MVALDFARLCGRPLDVMDFGGGWQPHVIEGTQMQEGIKELYEFCIVENNRQLTSLGRNGGATLTVQFELGKSVSERAGGLLCRVLEIREVEVQKQKWSRSFSSEDENGEAIVVVAKKRAIIVDSTVGEVSIPHLHPIFWRHSNCNGSSKSWKPLSSAGQDEIWGRTCMEFDVLVGSTSGWSIGRGSCGLGAAGIIIPADLQAGDFLLIAGCGAYDMSMQYDFGDGKGRSRCLVAL
jgi:diaminopimelate decarboxylase